MAKHPHTNNANRYAREVVAGKIAACSYVVAACQRHIDDLKKAGKQKYPYKFDKGKAEAVCNFVGLMVHVKGKWAGKPVALEPWQTFILCVVFGWVGKRDDLRRFREVYIEVPRKNGKSMLAAIIGLYMFVADGESGSEVYSGATTEKQAWEVFRPAKLMIDRSPDFKDSFGILNNAKNIYHPMTASRFEPLIGDPGDGASPHCAIVDEYHEAQTPRLHDTMITGMGAREQPLLIVTTTAGIDLAGPCYDKRSQVCRVLDGTVKNEETFGIIYSIDKDDEWTDFSNWKKANPNYGVSVFGKYLKARLLEATQRASRQNIIRCKHLNQWQNADVAFFNILEWEKCTDRDLLLSDFEGEPCWVGLDLASKIDIAALIILFRRGDNFYTFGKYYLPAETVNKPENFHYQGWEYEDLLTVTEGSIIDFDIIIEDIKELASRFEIQEIAYDPFQATQMSTQLTADGFPMVEVRPTVLNFSEPMKELEGMVVSNALHHNGDPVLAWMASNVVAHYDKKDNIYPNKSRVQNKIDGIIALIMAVARATLGDVEAPSAYENRGVLTF